MKKRIFLSLAAIVAITLGVVGFSAFEAHVINVTATIENALNVPVEPINFGTVFPQEQLDREFDIALSQSFLDESRVADVQYMIRQKPKCAVTTDNGEVLVGPTATGHIVVGDDPATTDAVEEYWIDCGEAPRELATGETWGVLPSLCPYLSKHQLDTDESSVDVPAFHEPFTIVEGEVVYTEAKGDLLKPLDTSDTWNIDLKVPCFGGYCAQDWAEFVTGINPQAIPGNYTQPIANEHKVFGCDLWVEVTEVSQTGEQPVCGNGIVETGEECDDGNDVDTDKCKNDCTLPVDLCSEMLDAMLVIDRSGSVSGDMDTLKTASKAFVDALKLTADGPHAGGVSFSDTATLDSHLTDDAIALKAVIEGLVSTGRTNLEAAIVEAQTELDDNMYDRDDTISPDFMIILTDGEPNECINDDCNGNYKGAAADAATAAKGAGTTIYVVGIGSGVDATYLQGISSGEGFYYNATNFADLQPILTALAECD